MVEIMTHAHWYGKVAGNAESIAERLIRDFPVGSRVATSATVGTWSHELNIETVTKIRKENDRIVFVTDRFVRGFHADDFLVFDFHRLKVATKNFMQPPDPIEWLFVLIDEEGAS